MEVFHCCSVGLGQKSSSRGYWGDFICKALQKQAEVIRKQCFIRKHQGAQYTGVVKSRAQYITHRRPGESQVVYSIPLLDPVSKAALAPCCRQANLLH